jgi:hypothetical protein
MLQEVKGDSPVFIQGDDLAVYEGAGWEPFARAGDLRELFCKEVSSPRPENDALPISPSKAPVAIEFHFIEPFFTFRQLLNQSRIHRLDETDLCFW